MKINNLPNFIIGDKVIYARGIRSMMIGKNGVVISIDDDDVYCVNVDFDNYGCYNCFRGNLDKL